MKSCTLVLQVFNTVGVEMYDKPGDLASETPGTMFLGMV